MIELLNELRHRNIHNIDPAEGRHECENCYSTGFNPDSLEVYEPCFSCSGHGHLTWIDNVTKERRLDVNKETVECCNLNNIVFTLTYLKRALRKLNLGHVSISINLESVDVENRKETVDKLVHLLKCYDLI